jgi:hypothetical protein
LNKNDLKAIAKKGQRDEDELRQDKRKKYKGKRKIPFRGLVN